MLRPNTVLPALALLAASAAAPAQVAHYAKTHGVSISVGATGNFATPLTTNPSTQTVRTGVNTTETIYGQNQYITSSPGFLTSLQFHPVPWAGVELNYGFQHYSERFNYNLASRPGTRTTNFPTSTHEFTAAYQFHARRIPLQPFLNVGGGAIDFVPTSGGGAIQWRGAGLAETGFEVAMPYTSRKLALRIQGRALFYRAPNFENALLSTRSWRVSSQPSASFVYRF